MSVAVSNRSVSLKLAAGHYVLICNLPGHYLAGQLTDFTGGLSAATAATQRVDAS